MSASGADYLSLLLLMASFDQGKHLRMIGFRNLRGFRWGNHSDFTVNY